MCRGRLRPQEGVEHELLGFFRVTNFAYRRFSGLLLIVQRPFDDPQTKNPENANPRSEFLCSGSR